MKNKSKYLASRLEEVLLNGQWIANTNILDKLLSTNLKQASHKIGDHNSIAQLTFHINYYVAGILNVFQGGDLEIRDKYSFDMATINSEKDWQNLCQSLKQNSIQIIEKISSEPEDIWEKDFVKKEYGTYERNIDGLIEHSYYHLGQISLLVKLQEENL